MVAAETKVVPDRLTEEARRIVYAEGDRGFKLDDEMTVERFATVNRGDYLVVEFELH